MSPSDAATVQAVSAAIVALLTLSAGGLRPQTPATPVHRGEHHSFVIDNFRTESGVTLPKATVVYGTFGRLNATRDNTVLLPSHYMANHHGYDWLIGPGQAPSCSATASRRHPATRRSRIMARAFR